MIQSSRLDKARVAANKTAFDKEKIRIETEYIPAQLGKMSTNELTTVGSNLWGE